MLGLCVSWLCQRDWEFSHTAPSENCRTTSYSLLGIICDFSSRKLWKKACNTRCSQAVSHLSTDRARRSLSSEIERDREHSTWYGRRREMSKIYHWRRKPYEYISISNGIQKIITGALGRTFSLLSSGVKWKITNIVYIVGVSSAERLYTSTVHLNDQSQRQRQSPPFAVWGPFDQFVSVFSVCTETESSIQRTPSI